jgi:hypothetical protein
MKNRLVISIAVIFLIGLVIWEIIPPKESTQIFEVNGDLTKQRILADCTGLEELISRKWKITYPGSVSSKDTVKISAILLDESETMQIHQKGNSNCKFAIETRWKYTKNNQKIEKSIISSYQECIPLKFDWETMMGEEEMVGNIWIYLLSSEENEGLSRTPLLVIPVNIENSSILNISPRSFRIITAGILILLIISSVFLFHKKVNDII